MEGKQEQFLSQFLTHSRHYTKKNWTAIVAFKMSESVRKSIYGKLYMKPKLFASLVSVTFFQSSFFVRRWLGSFREAYTKEVFGDQPSFNTNK